jgi:hypothetical protein
MKSKKRQQKKAWDVPLTNNSHRAHDAPDNPPHSVRKRVIVDTRGILNDPENWDERLQPRLSTLVDDMHNARGWTDNGHINQHVDCDSDWRDTSTRNRGSRLSSSELTPLDEVEEIQTSGARWFMQSAKGGSPVIDRGPDRTHREPISSDTLQALKEEARIVNEHLRIAHNEHLQGNSDSLNKSDTRSTSSYDKIKINLSHNENESIRENSDKNNNEAMCNLHTPIRWLSETREDYKAQQAASAHLRKKHAAEILERCILCTHITIVDELNQLLDEQEEYDATHHNPIETDRRNHHTPDGNKSDDLRRDKEMRRREHYVEWLSTQNVLDSMRHDDLWNTSKSNIPNHDKRPAYGGYPRSDSVRCSRSNASPGPSHPRDNNNYMGNDPSEPSDDSDHLDSTYRWDESESTNTTTQDTDEEGSSSNDGSQGWTHRHQRRESNNSRRHHTYDDHRRKRWCTHRRGHDSPSDLSDSRRSLLSPTYSTPFRCGMPRSPMESELICAESKSVRMDWLVPIWQGHLCNRARTPRGLGSD